jgi:hypothetical protein
VPERHGDDDRDSGAVTRATDYEEGATARFRVGDRMRVCRENDDGNPRTPPYVRGRTGEIVRAYGIVANPLDHLHPYPPLYTIRFPLSPEQPTDNVYADLHEDWLEPVSGDDSATGPG